MAICANCGHEVNGSKKRCTNCGAPLRDISLEASLAQQPTLGIDAIEALNFEIPDRSSDDLLNYSFGLDLDRSVGSASFATGDLVQNGEDLAQSLDSSSSVLSSSVASSSGFFNSASSLDTSSSIISNDSLGAEFSLESSLAQAASVLDGTLASSDSVLNDPKLADDIAAAGTALQDSRIKLSQSYGEARHTYESTRDEVKADLRQTGRSLRQGVKAAKAGQAQAGPSLVGRVGAAVAGAAAMTAGVAQAASAVSDGANAVARGTQRAQATYEDTSRNLAARVKRLSEVVSSDVGSIGQLVDIINKSRSDILKLQKSVNLCRNNALFELKKYNGGYASLLSGKSDAEIEAFKSQTAEADELLKSLFVEGSKIAKLDNAIRPLSNQKSENINSSTVKNLAEQINALPQNYAAFEREAKMFFAWWEKVSQEKGNAQAAAATATAALGLAADNAWENRSASRGSYDSSDDERQRLRREMLDAIQTPGANSEEIDNHIILSILTTMFCCFPLGIVALYMSAMSVHNKSTGNLEKARDYSAKALKWAGFSIVGGILFWAFMMLTSD